MDEAQTRTHYRTHTGFRLFETRETPRWRSPQLGALGALVAHWSLPRATPALISLPTGTGKSAVGVAAPYLVGANRVLVVVPSTDLRRQMTRGFRDEDLLRGVGAVEGDAKPLVIELTGRVGHWSSLERADVVVAIPNSISPAYYESNPPPVWLFDMIVIDEAHHAPARTWRLILDHWPGARVVLLTATPRRRDNQRVPGDLIYHYPLRQALAEGIFKVIEPRLLPLPATSTRSAIDAVIADEVTSQLRSPDHATSTALVRAGTIERARELAALYETRGIATPVLTSALRRSTQEEIIEDLRNGQHRAVAVVGMLVEGFDLPNLRILAYHDKHKSLLATAQTLGRLARADSRYPQPSVLVTVRDIDIYPQLEGVVRQLYEEDPEWATILPSILEAEIAADLANRGYAQAFTPAPPNLALDAVNPLHRAVILEIPPEERWEPGFLQGQLPEPLQDGRVVRARSVLYSGVSPDRSTLMLVTVAVARPPWHDDPGLDTPLYELHLISYRRAPRTTLPALLFLNSDDAGVRRELLRILEAPAGVRPADPDSLNAAFDSLERLSVSSVGFRNTYGATRGTASYRILTGSGVDRSLRESDTAFSAVGHAMAQVASEGGAFTAGMSTGKAKYWETRHGPLREYDSFISSLAERYWYPPTPLTGQLLPDVARGRRLTSWPSAPPIAVELNDALIGLGWTIDGVGPIEMLDFSAGATAGSAQLPIEASIIDGGARRVIWTGFQDLTGTMRSSGPDLVARRGFSGEQLLSDLLAARPPTIFFLDGTTVHSSVIFDSRARPHGLPFTSLLPWTWDGCDIEAETPVAARSRGRGRSVHEVVEEYLRAQPRRARHRWIVRNDGAAELADYVVIEAEGASPVYLSLWHAKAAGGAPSVRVMDFQEAVAQAIKSRRWITEVQIWQRLGARLNGRESPEATMVEGNRRLLEVLCGENPRFELVSYPRRRPLTRGEIGIAQPGLSREQFVRALAAGPPIPVVQTRDLLAVLHDSVSQVAQSVVVLCSA